MWEFGGSGPGRGKVVESWRKMGSGFGVLGSAVRAGNLKFEIGDLRFEMERVVRGMIALLYTGRGARPARAGVSRGWRVWL